MIRETWIRFCVVVGLALLAGGALAVALTLIPTAVKGTTDRIWIGIALFGAVLAFSGAAVLYIRKGLERERMATYELLARLKERREEHRDS